MVIFQKLSFNLVFWVNEGKAHGLIFTYEIKNGGGNLASGNPQVLALMEVERENWKERLKKLKGAISSQLQVYFFLCRRGLICERVLKFEESVLGIPGKLKFGSYKV